MTEQPTNKQAKHILNRTKLSQAAQRVLLQHGYAKSSLRDIAVEAGVSLGRLHYYFTDKSHLMISVFHDHQSRFIQTIHEVAAMSAPADLRCKQMARVWAKQVQEGGQSYRIWYDLRNQALFDPDLRPIVTEMEEQQVAALASLLGAAPATPRIFDRIRNHYVPLLGGLFHFALQRTTFDHPLDIDQLEQSFNAILQHVLDEMTA